jgi:hypothetical protein
VAIIISLEYCSPKQINGIPKMMLSWCGARKRTYFKLVVGQETSLNKTNSFIDVLDLTPPYLLRATINLKLPLTKKLDI